MARELVLRQYEGRRRLHGGVTLDCRAIAALDLLQLARRPAAAGLRLLHDDPRGRSRQVVEDACRTVTRGLGHGGAAAVFFERVAQREDSRPVQQRHGPLRARVVAPQRFNHVADELHPQRIRIAGRKAVDHAAADAELTVLIDRVGRDEPAVGQQIAQVQRRYEVAHDELTRSRQQACRTAHARQQRGDRRHRHPRRAAGESGQRAPARRGRVQVRRDAAVRIDFGRRQRQDRPFERGAGRPGQCAVEEPDVADHLLDAAVGRHDEQHRLGGGGASDRESLRRRRQPGDRRPLGQCVIHN
ncbi:MAG: hypothetical protein F4Y57_10115 [Acidobacteria bacterium]|nr:hypothetical protein [Acidobacteriota bacterium]